MGAEDALGRPNKVHPDIIIGDVVVNNDGFTQSLDQQEVDRRHALVEADPDILDLRRRIAASSGTIRQELMRAHEAKVFNILMNPPTHSPPQGLDRPGPSGTPLQRTPRAAPDAVPYRPRQRLTKAPPV